MRKFFKNDLEILRQLHRNENGAEAGLERILLVAFIALPLLGLLIYYKGKVVTFISGIWTSTTGSGPTDMTGGPTQ
jgi:Flp pilus assembly pilin Flp